MKRDHAESPEVNTQCDRAGGCFSAAAGFKIPPPLVMNGCFSYKMTNMMN